MTKRITRGPGRRAFFRETFLRVVGPVTDYLEGRAPPTRGDATPASSGSRFSRPLRPPGAIDEFRFSEVCQRCGACVEICPAHAIFPLSESAGRGAGTPVIDADRAACVVCTGLMCTTVCPSGALLPILEPRDIRMGLAEVYASVCVRSAGESCTICVDRCPLGTAAIRFNDDGPPEVLSPGCVGCGVCQLFCPTTPKAIVVTPS